MTVRNIWYDQELVPAVSLESVKDSSPGYSKESPTFKMLQKCAVLGSKAGWNMALPDSRGLKPKDKLKLTEEQQLEILDERLKEYYKELMGMPRQNWPTTGDASESGLIKFFQPIRDIDEMRKEQPLVEKNGLKAEIPFNSSNKYALQIREPSDENPEDHKGEYLLLLKGAPERVYGMCSHYLFKGREQEISQDFTSEFNIANKYFADNGQRVLGFAYLWLPRDRFPRGFEFDTANINFPINNLVFIGLISLEDPPRKNVPFAVEKCQTAGIKVIMVTGDQPDTAAAIARQVGIITSDKTVNEIAQDHSVSFEEAFDFSDAIVIHGDMLARATDNDRLLPLDQRGKLLESWLKKKEVVFARTSPAHKLIIVEGCQRLGHIVAVTGDGVNDSPAIKKADIGIAMGVVGSDVAKDAADMVLLTDDFAAIVTGVEEGRLIFDNLKKTICYMMAVNIPQLVPFIFLVIFQLPLGLTTILQLFISVGTDIVPAIAMAYEKAESDIMLRPPRNNKTERLVQLNLIGYAYLHHGIIETCAGFYTYFVVFHDYGFTANVLFFLVLKDGTKPHSGDKYDTDKPYRGNTRAQETNGHMSDKVDFNNDSDDKKDLRLWFWKVNKDEWCDCHYDVDSDISNSRICWTTEALRQAQTAFFVACVLTQISNYLTLRTRKLSIIQQGISNRVMYLGFATETIFCIIIVYIVPLGRGIGTRRLQPLHFGVPAMPFFIFMIVYDELRRLMLRLSIAKSKTPGFIERLTYT